MSTWKRLCFFFCFFYVPHILQKKENHWIVGIFQYHTAVVDILNWKKLANVIGFAQGYKKIDIYTIVTGN